MKILLTLVIQIILIGLHQSVSTSTQFGLKCVFSQNKIKCENVGISGQDVECDSVSNIAGLGSTFFNIFGIGLLPLGYDTTTQDTHLVSLFLYPRTLDDVVYLDHTIKLNGKTVDLTLYHSHTNTGNGIRVTDHMCFTRLLGLVDQVQKSGVQNVNVQASLIGDSHEEKLVGEVVIEGQNLQKRHFNRWGWGGWRGQGGWGFGAWGGYRRWGGIWGPWGKK